MRTGTQLSSDEVDMYHDLKKTFKFESVVNEGMRFNLKKNAIDQRKIGTAADIDDVIKFPDDYIEVIRDRDELHDFLDEIKFWKKEQKVKKVRFFEGGEIIPLW
jgi:hypothetical protein